MSPEARQEAQEKDRKGKQRAKDALIPEKLAEKARQKHLSKLKQKLRRWEMAADNRDASKTLSLPFDKSAHILKTECIKLVEKAKVSNQKTKNEDGSHQANVCVVCVVCVVCDEFVFGTQVLQRIDEKKY